MKNEKKILKNIINIFIKQKKQLNKYQLIFILFLILILYFSNGDSFKFIKSYHLTNQNRTTPIEINLKNPNTEIKTNIDLNDEFFRIKEVKQQIFKKNLTYIETLAGPSSNIGNALIVLNNLINICINIKCKNIITPNGTLENIIKNPIYNKEYNILILPNSYENKTKIDIKIHFTNIFFFKYKKKPNLVKLNIIREEVLNNIPKYFADPKDLYINIRSGEIFVNVINKYYSQPPLCFYQKIINDSNYRNYYILANGHENPVIDKLMSLYPKIKYIHGSIVDDVSVIINAYNFVLSLSTFPLSLIYLNNNLMNLYIYDMMNFNYLETLNSNLNTGRFKIHKMKPSTNYFKYMNTKWENSKFQLNLMLSEKCDNIVFSKNF